MTEIAARSEQAVIDIEPEISETEKVN